MGLFSDSDKEKNQKTRQSLTPTMIKKLKEAAGKCEKCKHKNGLDVHHIKSISKGGSNVPSNLVVLCPNHHRAAHNGTMSQSDLKQVVKKRSAHVKNEFKKILRDRKKVEGRETRERGFFERLIG